MKIKRSTLERLVREELVRALRELDERGPPPVDDAEDDNRRKERGPKVPGDVPPKVPVGKGPGRPPEDKVPSPPPTAGPRADAVPPSGPPGEEPDVAAKVDDDGVAATKGDTGQAKSKVGDEVTGKRIQSISLEPKSKVMPGAQELVITFDEVPDPFKVLITKSGKIVYWWKGIHQTLE